METTALAERQNGALVNPETGEMTIARVFENEFDVKDLLTTAGKVDLTEGQKKILFAPVDPENVEIRPDGITYLPWMQYASRLSDAFGLKWALIPQGMPRFKNNFVYWGHWLIIDGHLAGFSIGEQRYFPESKGGRDFMTYGDACEGAKSNALMRLCKGLGISIELWKPSFVRDWKAQHAVSFRDAQGKTVWKRKDAVNGKAPVAHSKPPVDDIPDFKVPEPEIIPSTSKPDNTPPAVPSKYAPMTDKQRKMLWALMKKAELSDTEAKNFFTWFNGSGSLTIREATLFIDKFDQHLAKYQEQTREPEPDMLEEDDGR